MAAQKQTTGRKVHGISQFWGAKQDSILQKAIDASADESGRNPSQKEFCGLINGFFADVYLKERKTAKDTPPSFSPAKLSKLRTGTQALTGEEYYLLTQYIKEKTGLLQYDEDDPYQQVITELQEEKIRLDELTQRQIWPTDKDNGESMFDDELHDIANDFRDTTTRLLKVSIRLINGSSVLKVLNDVLRICDLLYKKGKTFNTPAVQASFTQTLSELRLLALKTALELSPLHQQGYLDNLVDFIRLIPRTEGHKQMLQIGY